MLTIAKNIRFLRTQRKLSQEQLADELGITRSRIGSYEEGRSEPNIQLLITLSDFFKLPVDMLIKHDLAKAGKQPLIHVGQNRVLFPVMVDENNNDTIEVVSAKASAGYLNGYADPEYVEGLKRMNLPFIPSGKHRAFPISGDSMPPLGKGSYVVGKFVEDIKNLHSGQTYVLLTRNDGIVYKRVYNDLKKDKTLLLVSDNKSYEPYKVHAADVLEVWEYVCSINTGTYTENDLNLESIMQMLRQLQVELQDIRVGKAIQKRSG
jgi:transcriptional regulator with XRE-family HTH domain